MNRVGTIKSFGFLSFFLRASLEQRFTSWSDDQNAEPKQESDCKTFWAELTFAQKVPTERFRRFQTGDFLGNALGLALKVCPESFCPESRQLAQKVIGRVLNVWVEKS
jgi:hypothetical protein